MNCAVAAHEFSQRVKLNTGFALTWQWVFTGLKVNALSFTSVLRYAFRKGQDTSSSSFILFNVEKYPWCFGRG